MQILKKPSASSFHNYSFPPIPPHESKRLRPQETLRNYFSTFLHVSAPQRSSTLLVGKTGAEWLSLRCSRWCPCPPRSERSEDAAPSGRTGTGRRVSGRTGGEGRETGCWGLQVLTHKHMEPSVKGMEVVIQL